MEKKPRAIKDKRYEEKHKAERICTQKQGRDKKTNFGNSSTKRESVNG